MTDWRFNDIGRARGLLKNGHALGNFRVNLFRFNSKFPKYNSETFSTVECQVFKLNPANLWRIEKCFRIPDVTSGVKNCPHPTHRPACAIARYITASNPSRPRHREIGLRPVALELRSCNGCLAHVPRREIFFWRELLPGKFR